MRKAKLIERLPDGSYTVTQFGKLILSLSLSIEFALKHRQYFLNHDVWQLPSAFIHRLGQLSQGVLLTEMGEVMIRWEELIRAAEDHLWVMTPQFISSLSHVAKERHLKGVRVGCINPEQLSLTSRKYMLTDQTVERRFLNGFNFGIFATEKEATLALPLRDGTPSPTDFLGRDALFLKWVDDLFLHCWNLARR